MQTIKVTIKENHIELPCQLFINNQWVSGESSIEVVNPATEKSIGHFHTATREQVDQAVVAAENAFQVDSPWRKMAHGSRGKLLFKLADLIERDHTILAQLETLNTGKIIGESYGYDLNQVINCLRYFAGWCDKIQGKTIPLANAENNSTVNHLLAYTKQVPIGVVALILPWNFPLQLLMWKLAPCLAAGNTCIIKPSEVTPITTLYLAKLIVEAGFPPGVVNVLNGTGAVVGDALSSHMRIKKVAFTGSTRVGKMVQIAATNSNLKHVSLELGGKSPLIVFDDVDEKGLQSALLGAYHGLFWNAGQCCSASSRIFVQEGIYDRFVQGMIELVKKRKLGDPFDKESTQGPQVSKVQMESVQRYIKLGKECDAKLAFGGDKYEGTGYFVKPTIFTHVDDNAIIAREEIFGPVMAILKPFKTAQEVIKRANNSEYGLVGSVFTKNINQAMIVSDQIHSGLTWVNCYNVIDPSIPWGGFGLTGNGRDLSERALFNYTEEKAYIISSSL